MTMITYFRGLFNQFIGGIYFAQCFQADLRFCFENVTGVSLYIV